MGLKLLKTLQTNQDVEYWEIKEVVANSNGVTTWLKGWKSKLDKDSGAEEDTIVKLENLSFNINSVFNSVYTRIKQHPDWTEAIDE